MRLIEEETSEHYEFIPASLRVIQDVCLKYACHCTVKTGGNTAAVLRSFIASCKRSGVEPFTWFHDVVSRIPTYSIKLNCSRKTESRSLPPRPDPPHLSNGLVSSFSMQASVCTKSVAPCSNAAADRLRR
jgi:hypothetical protein